MDAIAAMTTRRSIRKFTDAPVKPEDLETMHDAAYWRAMVSRSRDAEVIEVSEMESNEEVWADWLRQENEYAVGDRKSMEAGGGKYLNFIKIVLRRK